VTGTCECDDEPSGSDATDLVMEFNRSWPCSKETDTRPFPERTEANQHIHTSFPVICLCIRQVLLGNLVTNNFCYGILVFMQ
jgi:hypothetical protein